MWNYTGTNVNVHLCICQICFIIKFIIKIYINKVLFYFFKWSTCLFAMWPLKILKWIYLPLWSTHIMCYTVLEHDVTQQHNTYEGVLSTSDVTCDNNTYSCSPLKRWGVFLFSSGPQETFSSKQYLLTSQLAGVLDRVSRLLTFGGCITCTIKHVFYLLLAEFRT